MSNTPDELDINQFDRNIVSPMAAFEIAARNHYQGKMTKKDWNDLRKARFEFAAKLNTHLAYHREAVEREARIDEAGNAIASLENSDGASKDLEVRLYKRLNQLKQQPELQEESDDE